MNRQNLIHRLVARKLQSADQTKIFCVCMAKEGQNALTPPKALCFAGKALCFAADKPRQ